MAGMATSAVTASAAAHKAGLSMGSPPKRQACRTRFAPMQITQSILGGNKALGSRHDMKFPSYVSANSAHSGAVHDVGRAEREGRGRMAQRPAGRDAVAARRHREYRWGLL